MGEMDEKINALLNNPQLMSSILSMAQSLEQTTPPSQNSDAKDRSCIPEIDLSMLQKLGSMAGQSQIDAQQKALLNALRPYLDCARVAKLEKAMRAAKMAKMATFFLNSGGLQLLSGR